MRTLATSTLTPALALDAEQRITDWNASACELLGYPCESVIGEHCWKILCGRDTAGNRYCAPRCMLCRMALEGEPIGAVQLSVRHASGRSIRCNVTTLSGRFPAQGEIVHLLEPESRDASRRDWSGAFEVDLTPRERDILVLLDQGRTTAEISGVLSIASSTVRSHVEHILRKLGVHSRLGALAEGRRLGLLG